MGGQGIEDKAASESLVPGAALIRNKERYPEFLFEAFINVIAWDC